MASLPQVNPEMTVGAMKQMYDEIEHENRPFTKKMASLDGVMRYTRLALETYPDSQAIVEPIDEPIFKFRITVLQKV